MKKTKISVGGNRIDVDQGFLDGLEYMGTLTDLYRPDINEHIPKDLQKPLYFLFDRAKARMKLAGRDRDLPERLKTIKGLEDFVDFVSDTDEKHTIAVVDYASKITTGELNKIDPDAPPDFSLRMPFSGLGGYLDYDRKKLLSAAICHDCAYPITAGTQFRDKEIRKLHQQEAAEEFKKLAEAINKRFDFLGRRVYRSDLIFKNKLPPFYSQDETDGTVYIISLHDSPPFSPLDKHIELLLSHREADRLWMLDRAGFALDILRKLIKSNEGEYCPLEMLAHNVARHIEEARAYSEENRKVIRFRYYENYPTLYATNKGFEIFKELIEKRMQEYNLSRDDFFKKLQKRLERGEGKIK